MTKDDFREMLKVQVEKLGDMDTVGNQFNYYSSQELDAFYHCFLMGIAYVQDGNDLNINSYSSGESAEPNHTIPEEERKIMDSRELIGEINELQL